MTSDSSKEEPEMFISCSVYLTVCSFLKDRKGKHKQQNKKLHRYIVLSSVCYTEHCLWPPPSWVTQHHPESLHAFSAFLGGRGFLHKSIKPFMSAQVKYQATQARKPKEGEKKNQIGFDMLNLRHAVGAHSWHVINWKSFSDRLPNNPRRVAATQGHDKEGCIPEEDNGRAQVDHVQKKLLFLGNAFWCPDLMWLS